MHLSSGPRLELDVKTLLWDILPFGVALTLPAGRVSSLNPNLACDGSVRIERQFHTLDREYVPKGEFSSVRSELERRMLHRIQVRAGGSKTERGRGRACVHAMCERQGEDTGRYTVD